MMIFFFKISQINTKKTTKKLPPYTTLLTKPNLYQKIYTSANSKLKLTTKLTIKHDEPFSKCYSYVETKSNNLKNYSNQISCNTDCNVVKKVFFFLFSIQIKNIQINFI